MAMFFFFFFFFPPHWFRYVLLKSGRILETIEEEKTSLLFSFRIAIDTDLCTGCGNCCTACPVNKIADAQMGAGGHSSNDEVIMRVQAGDIVVIHEDKCTGCKTCEVSCPTGAIRHCTDP